MQDGGECMADNRKYYYLKLKENFFESEEIKILESMKDGYIYSNILLKLYLRSLRNEGRLMYRNIIPYTPEILATLTGHQVGTVEKALEVFKKLGLIEVLDNGAIYMMDIQNFIGKSSTEADRQREYYNKVNNEKKAIKNRPALTAHSAEQFDTFWSCYPLDKKKDAAKKAYCDIVNSGTYSEDDLISSARNYAEFCSITKNDKIYHADNFISTLAFKDYLPGKYKKPKRRNGLAMQQDYDFDELEKKLEGNESQ